MSISVAGVGSEGGSGAPVMMGTGVVLRMRFGGALKHCLAVARESDELN